ncbi:MAG: aminopeptidase P family protein [Chloroflexi bacterium]|nr:MAG: aminopeptidase P family protein [Chloroflexota bacterium]
MSASQAAVQHARSKSEPPFDRARASALMEEQGVDLIVACSRANVGYLADYTYYVAQGLPYVLEDGRQWSITFVGVPRDSKLEPFITPVSSEHGSISYADPWIGERRFWGPKWTYAGQASPTAAGAPGDVASCVADAITERGLASGRVAIELEGTPAPRYLRLRELLPKAEFVDAARILDALRIVKTPTEIARLREVARVTDLAIRAGYEALSETPTELQVQSAMARVFVEHGMSFGWCSVAYGPKGVTLIEPTELHPTVGEIVRIDVVGIHHGYYSDMSRVNSFRRRPNDDCLRAHAAILETNSVMRRETGPGVCVADLARIAHETLGSHGYPMLAPQAGHGIGRDVHEPPYLADWDPTVLRPGMVLDLEPAMRVAGVGSVNIEDMVLVTDSGCEVLTQFPRELETFG